MPARKPSQPQLNLIAPASTKPAIVALKKSSETQPESAQEVVEQPVVPVEPLTPVEPPASESQPKKVSPPIKRAKATLPDVSQEAEATTAQAEPSPEGDADSVPNNALFQAVGIIWSLDYRTAGAMSKLQKGKRRRKKNLTML